MGQMNTLLDAVRSIETLADDETIYASKPWSEESLVSVRCNETQTTNPIEIRGSTLNYFIEVSIAKEFLEDWIVGLDHTPSANERCIRLITYAERDA